MTVSTPAPAFPTTASRPKELRQDGELAAQVSMEALTEPFEVQVDDLATVQHAFETMARSVVGPRLAEELDTSPLDTGQMERLRPLMGALPAGALVAVVLVGLL